MTALKDPLIVNTSKGLYCPPGDFYIDPWRAVPRALITHAHSDHARSGSKSYLTAESGFHVLKARLGQKSAIETLPYGKTVTIDGVTVSFHSAGHVLGSAQIRVEHRDRVWVVSGDYKTKFDATCAPFDPVKCDCFITESTFGLPIYRWTDPRVVAEELNSWWAENNKMGRASLVFAYSFGKAQRLLSMADPSIGPIFVHPTVDKMNAQYKATGVKLPTCSALGDTAISSLFSGALVIAPPNISEEWLTQLGDYSTAFASGWMRIRAARRRETFDRGFVLSDHADWSELLEVIKQTEAEEVIVTHGHVNPLVKYLNGIGLKARSFKTKFAEPDEEQVAVITRTEISTYTTGEESVIISGSMDTGESLQSNLAPDGSCPLAASTLPYPFHYADTTQDSRDIQNNLSHWFAEWKWDGLRVQLAKRNGSVSVWSHGGSLLNQRIPEIVKSAAGLCDGVVLDGELLAWKDGDVLSLTLLQQRLSLSKPSTELLAEIPLVFMAYDLLEENYLDVRLSPIEWRKERLAQVLSRRSSQTTDAEFEQLKLFAPCMLQLSPSLRLSPVLNVETWESVMQLIKDARLMKVEGVMLKRRNSHYSEGRKTGTWKKYEIGDYCLC